MRWEKKFFFTFISHKSIRTYVNVYHKKVSDFIHHFLSLGCCTLKSHFFLRHNFSSASGCYFILGIYWIPHIVMSAMIIRGCSHSRNSERKWQKSTNVNFFFGSQKGFHWERERNSATASTLVVDLDEIEIIVCAKYSVTKRCFISICSRPLQAIPLNTEWERETPRNGGQYESIANF